MTARVNPVNLREPLQPKGSHRKTTRRDVDSVVSVNLVNLFYRWVGVGKGGNILLYGGYPFAYGVHKVHTILKSVRSLAIRRVNPGVHNSWCAGGVWNGR